MFYAYILFSEKLGIYYVGSTGNLNDRLKRHNEGRSKFTKPGVPWKLVYQKEFSTKSDACKFEKHIKAQKSRKFIEELIQSV
ncbi:MAG: GIY-YIG nuclease family protein [Porphyromonadaceae bacterium]|nr:GIY-YIG nuclease family protein [Porphyromonadaceae bacterium]